jgi:predicted transcriptional regulator
MSATVIYDNLAGMLVSLPASTAELATQFGLQRRTVARYLRELYFAGMVAPQRLRQREGKVYVRADKAPFRPVSQLYAAQALHRFVAAWHALRARQTTDTLAGRLGVSRRTASVLIHALHDHHLVTVCAWEMRHKTLVPMYDRLPRSGDAPRPPRATRRECNARHWALRTQRLQAARAATGAAA